MKIHPTKTWTRLALPLLFLIIGIIPAKAQLYAGGGFSYYTSEVTLSDVTYLNISPELGYRYHRLSAGLGFSYNTITYSNNAYTDSKQYTLVPYIRYDIIVRKGLGLFADAFYSHSHYTESQSTEQVIHEVGVIPGIYYKLSDRFTALFRFGFFGYSSHYNNGFEGFGIDLSTNTAQVRFYYSFW